VEGAYSLLCLTESAMIAVRDPMGFRPLCIGKLSGQREAYVVSSEPSSFELIDAEFIRDVAPGEIVIFERKGVRSIRPFADVPRKSCIFEYVYFARPDATIDGLSVYEARKNLGRALAKEHAVDADLVIPVPDSGVPATIGYAEESGVRFELGLVRSHYVGRTFIEPEQSIRHFGVRLKLSPISDLLRGKRLLVIDDSIVRGTTSRKIVKMLRDAGAKEVHMRISSPPRQWPCYYGIDTPTRAELIASSHSVEEINHYITSDSLAYLSLDSMREAVLSARSDRAREAAADSSRLRPSSNGLRLPVVNPEMNETSFCDACWSGTYPVQFTPHPRQRQMRLLDV
jgi:amidophosphoribosyltransferase